MPFSRIALAVPGQLGPATALDSSIHPPKVESLDYVLDAWDGDELVEVFPCFVATRELAEQLVAATCSGFRLDRLTVSTSEQFEELYAGVVLPSLVRLVIHGRPGVHDLGLTADATLVVSDRALAVIAPRLVHYQSWRYTT